MPLTPQRVFHVNLNCTDLTRSHRWYTEVLGFTELVRTTPEQPQPGAAFGLDAVQWDAWILGGAAGHTGTSLDLLEWLVPPPTGAPPPATATGFGAVVIGVPDPDPLAATLAGATRDGDDVELTDPDGMGLRLVPADEVAVRGVRVGVSDLDASSAWYTGVLGLHQLDTTRFGVDDSFAYELVAARGSPVHRAANQVGVYRSALMTDDVERDHATLLAAGVTCLGPPASLDMGPGLPAELPTLFFCDPDGACLELIQV